MSKNAIGLIILRTRKWLDGKEENSTLINKQKNPACGKHGLS